jgi:hypothetical protein
MSIQPEYFASPSPFLLLLLAIYLAVREALNVPFRGVKRSSITVYIKSRENI